MWRARPHSTNALKTLIAALFASCLVLGPGLVRAAPEREGQADASKQASAAAHFERGVEFYREGSLEAALVEFERAYALIPNDRLLFNLAQIHAEQYDYAAALGLFEKYLRSGDPEIPAARRAEAQREIARLQARVAYLLVASDAQGARLFVNDTLVGQLPLAAPLAINPGVCNIRLEKAGYLPARQSLKVAASERPILHLNLVAGSEPSSSQPDRAQSGPPTVSRASYTPFWIASATTVALGATTLALGLTARNADHTLSNELEQVPADPQQTEDARSQLKLYSALTDTCAVLSVVGLGVSIYFLVKPPRSGAPSRQDAAQRSMQVLPGLRGVALRARF